MSSPTVIRMLIFCAIILLSICAGIYAFLSPQNIEEASRSAISAMSIIFGLSTAVSSMLTSHSSDLSSYSNDPHLAATQKKHAIKDDNMTRARQRALHLAALSSIIMGIAYLVAVKDSPCAFITRILAFMFSIATTISLFSTMLLPDLLMSLVKRNAYLQRKK